MTPEQFAAQMNDLVKKVLDDNAATRAHSSELHRAGLAVTATGLAATTIRWIASLDAEESQ